jgi:hypothetical protein
MRIWSKALRSFATAALLLPSTAWADMPAGAKPCTIDPALGLSARDTAKLGDLTGSRTRGLAAVLTEADANVRRTVAATFENGMLPITDIPAGDYRCRTIKLGAELSVVYGYFKCRIDKDGAGWTITKVTGSQNFAGILRPAGDGLIFKGAGNYSDEGRRGYDGNSERDMVGCLYREFAEEPIYALEIPSPALESLHDVIELVGPTPIR